MRCRVETVRAALDEPAAEQPSGGGGELVRCQKWETCRIVHGCPHSKKHGRIAASKDGTGCDKGLLGCPACVPVKEG
jgi:hypothetical protein